MSNQPRNILTITFENTDLTEEWVDNDSATYTWGVGPAGDLMIFKSTYHAAFTAQLSKDERCYCYAPGTWLTVEVSEQDEVEVTTGSTILTDNGTVQ